LLKGKQNVKYKIVWVNDLITWKKVMGTNNYKCQTSKKNSLFEM
jgi:hypothetical protein